MCVSIVEALVLRDREYIQRKEKKNPKILGKFEMWKNYFWKVEDLRAFRLIYLTGINITLSPNLFFYHFNMTFIHTSEISLKVISQYIFST